MADIGSEFDRYLRGREPETFDEAVREFQGRNPDMARAIAAVPEGIRPRDMTSEQRKAYNNALRQVARWRNTTGERRRAGSTARSRNALSRLLQGARSRSTRRRVDEIRRRGLAMRIRAEIRVSKAWKVHTMPSDVAGRPRTMRLDDLNAALSAWEAGNIDEAGALVKAAFFDAYWGNPDPAEMGDVEWVEFEQ